METSPLPINPALQLVSLDSEVSRRDTTLSRVRYLAQLPLGAPVGTQRWVRHALRIRVAENRQDRHLAAIIIRQRHYLGQWVAKPKVKILTYLAELAGCESSEAGCAGLVTVTLQPGNYHAAKALEVHPCSVLSLSRCWRADDLGPAVAPNFSPELLRRVVRGERGRGPLGPLGSEWAARKMTGGLLAPARLLCTYADPSVGHDGATYAAAGAVDCGLSLSGKHLFCWALDPVLDEPLRKYAAAKRDIDRERMK